MEGTWTRYSGYDDQMFRRFNLSLSPREIAEIQSHQNELGVRKALANLGLEYAIEHPQDAEVVFDIIRGPEVDPSSIAGVNTKDIIREAFRACLKLGDAGFAVRDGTNRILYNKGLILRALGVDANE